MCIIISDCKNWKKYAHLTILYKQGIKIPPSKNWTELSSYLLINRLSPL